MEEFEEDLVVPKARRLQEQRKRWQTAKLELEKAKLAYEYEVKRLRLERDTLLLEEPRDEISAINWRVWLEDVSTDPEEGQDAESVADVLASVAYVGESLGAACRGALYSLPVLRFSPGSENSPRLSYTSDEIVEVLKAGGFDFSSDAPAREVHGALVKQHWAQRDPKTGRWALSKNES